MHFGAPKTWYAVNVEQRDDFEKAAEAIECGRTLLKVKVKGKGKSGKSSPPKGASGGFAAAAAGDGSEMAPGSMVFSIKDPTVRGIVLGTAHGYIEVQLSTDGTKKFRRSALKFHGEPETTGRKHTPAVATTSWFAGASLRRWSRLQVRSSPRR